MRSGSDSSESKIGLTHGFGEMGRRLLVEELPGRRVAFTPRRPQDPQNGATAVTVVMIDEAQRLVRHLRRLDATSLPPSEVSGLWREETDDGVRFGVQVPTGFGLAIITGTWGPGSWRGGVLQSLVHGPGLPEWVPDWLAVAARDHRTYESLDELAEGRAGW